MNIMWFFTIIIHLLSVGFMGLCLMRLFGYTRRYRLKETHHTLLFRFIGLQHVVIAYIIAIAIFTMSSVFFITSLKT